MPVTVDIKYEYLTQIWPGRIKLAEMVLGVLALLLCGASYCGAQTWFLLVVWLCLIFTVAFSSLYVGMDAFVKDMNVNWIQLEFWLGVVAVFLYFSAWVTMLIEFVDKNEPKHEFWLNMQISAAVVGIVNNVLYGLGTYLVYIEWKASPIGSMPPPTIPA